MPAPMTMVSQSRPRAGSRISQRSFLDHLTAAQRDGRRGTGEIPCPTHPGFPEYDRVNWDLPRRGIFDSREMPMADGRSITRAPPAVAFADVASFAKLMELDDSQTILKWQALRHDLLEPKIAEHGGNLVQVMGDGLFIEFP